MAAYAQVFGTQGACGFAVIMTLMQLDGTREAFSMTKQQLPVRLFRLSVVCILLLLLYSNCSYNMMAFPYQFYILLLYYLFWINFTDLRLHQSKTLRQVPLPLW